MARSRTQNPASQVLKAVAAAGRPQTLPEIVQRIGPKTEAQRRAIEKAVHQQTELGSLQPCPRHRYWDHDEAQVHTEHALALIAEAPRTRAQLVTALGKLDTGASKSWREGLVRKLARSAGVYVWPPHGASRSERLATEPPDVNGYVTSVKRDFDAVVKKLAKAHIDRAVIVRAVVGPSGEPGAPPPVRSRPARIPPADEAERDFHRETAQELVFAWEDTEDPATRKALEQVMYNIGIRRMGDVGQQVPFDGTRHVSQDGLWPDDPAQIEAPGWELQRGTRSRVLAKANVRAAPRAS